MKKQTRALISAVGLVFIILAATISYNVLLKRSKEKASPKENINETQLAPDFTVLDQGGDEINLSDYKGKYIVLNFWASWCGFCREEMEGFNNIYNEYSNNDEIKIFMLNVTDGTRESKEDADAYYIENNFDFPIYYDTELDGTSLDATRKYGANSLPLTYLINKEDEVVGGRMGYFEEDQLGEAITKMMENY